MGAFTLERRITAPIEHVWQVLSTEFGDIQRWNGGVKRSRLTSSAGEVGVGTSRQCELAPFGSIHERIAHHEDQRRLTIHIDEVSRLPLRRGVADFELVPNGDTTTVVLHYEYEPTNLGRLMGSTLDRQLRKGLDRGLLGGLQRECERRLG